MKLIIETRVVVNEQELKVFAYITPKFGSTWMQRSTITKELLADPKALFDHNQFFLDAALESYQIAQKK